MRQTMASVTSNYQFRSFGTIDTGEVVDCSTCGRHYSTPGTHAAHFTRIPNQATHFPLSVELCESASSRLTFHP